MSASKNKVLLVVSVCIALAAAWFAIPSKEQIRDPDAGTPGIARKHASLSPDERLAEAYRILENMNDGQWQVNAYIVAGHGNQDEATEAIIDLIQNRESRTTENSKAIEKRSAMGIAMIQNIGFMDRLHILTPLGLTRTKRAEQFLLNAYENPSGVIANKKIKQLSHDPRFSDLNFASDRDLDWLTSSWSMRGLLLLDEPKYSPMLEEEFDRVAVEAESVNKKDKSLRTFDDYNQVAWFGIVLDNMVYRDMIRERGTENPSYMLDYEGYQREWWGYSHKYWDQSTRTRVVQKAKEPVEK